VTGAGIGGVPELRQILTPTQRFVHPFQPHVWLLKLISWLTVREYTAAMAAQLSSVLTSYEAHEPSAFGFGAKFGRDPAEQQTCWDGWSVEHKVEPGL
jgi:hypothetical protein